MRIFYPIGLLLAIAALIAPSSAKVSNETMAHLNRADCSACGPLSLIVPKESTIQPFFIGVSEVTWHDYLISVQEGGCPAPENRLRHPISGVFKLSDDYPVTGLTLSGVNCYIGWISRVTKTRYRLPTSEEWLYVAKRADQAKGSSILGRLDRSSTPAEPRDAVRGGAILPANHGVMSPDGLYGLLDSAGEMTSQTEVLPEERCRSYGARLCHRILVYGMSVGFTPKPYFEKAYVVDIYTNIYVGFRVARDAN